MSNKNYFFLFSRFFNPLKNLIFCIFIFSRIGSQNLGNLINNSNTKLISPIFKKNTKLTSTSNLPTANNSFYTISSADQNEACLDEYHEISYKNTKNNTRSNRKISYSYKLQDKIDEDIEVSEEKYSDVLNNNPILEKGIFNATKNPVEIKNKFKTEICKFWQVNMSCKFGDNVRFILIKYKRII